MRVTIINLQRRRQNANSWADAQQNGKHRCPCEAQAMQPYNAFKRCPHRGKTLRRKKPASSCARNLGRRSLVAKSGTGTGGLNSNDSGPGACPPLTARSLPASIRAETRAKRPDACKCCLLAAGPSFAAHVAHVPLSHLIYACAAARSLPFTQPETRENSLTRLHPSIHSIHTTHPSRLH